MRLAFGAGIVIALSLPSAAQDWDCSDPGNLPQQGMNFCAHRDFEKADKELNGQWAKLRDRIRASEADTPEYAGWFDILLRGQRGWIAYRDGQCEAQGYAFHGGSLEPFIVASCKAELTRARARELAEMLERLDQ